MNETQDNLISLADFLGVTPELLKGEQGETGDAGPQGITGETGAKGDKGDKGDRGERGIAGINGIDGLDGRDGVAGKDGVDGRDGKDAILDEEKIIEAVKERIPRQIPNPPRQFRIINNGTVIEKNAMELNFVGSSVTRGTNGITVTVPKITVSTTEPTSPSTGDLWVDTN